jgi:hypothetical protein
MTKLSDPMPPVPPVTPEQKAAYCRKIAIELEPTLQSYREALEALNKLPESHPVAVFIRAKLWRLEALVHGESSDKMADELQELEEILIRAGVVKAADPESCSGRVGDCMLGDSGFSYLQIRRGMAVATKKKRGRKRTDTAMKALIMSELQHKKLHEIADALCDYSMSPHKRQKARHPHKYGDKCSERFRRQIEELRPIYEKYKTRK